MDKLFWYPLIASVFTGLGVVFWAWFICYEVEQRQKEAEHANRG